MESKKHLVISPSAINVANYANNAEDDEKPIGILLVLTMTDQNKNDCSSIEKHETIATFRNHLEADLQE